MGMIECKTHGLTGFTSRLSKKISHKILSNLIINDSELIQITLNIYDEQIYLFSEKYLLEIDDINSTFTENMIVRNEDESNEFSKQLPELGGICLKCMEDYKEKNNISLLNFT